MTDLNKLITKVEHPLNDDNVVDWLTQQVTADRPYLLAHADDGVIWGAWLNQGVCTSYDVAPHFSPQLRGITLQQAFVFGRQDEIRLFHDELGNWQARQVVDADFKDKDTIIENQILWGDEFVAALNESFTHVRDRNQQGLDQVLPLKITPQDLLQGLRPRLEIHHFIEYDSKTGEARIGLSRLAAIGLALANIEEVLS
jgi:CRISPR-associated protein (TIGR03984 family)